MPNASDPRYLYCPRVECRVRVCRPEEECRREFGCTKPHCPLEGEFGLQAFDVRMKGFATAFDLWPVTTASTADFPRGPA